MLGHLNLRARMMLLAVAAMLPLSALTVWFALREIEEATEVAQSQLRLAASLVAANQDRMVESAQHLLGAVSALPGRGLPAREQCDQYFAALRERYPIYSGLGLLDPQGQVICHAGGRSADFNASDRPYFRETVEQRRFVMGQPTTGRLTGRLVIPFSQPVFEGNRLIAVAFAAFDLEQAEAALDRVELPPGSRLIVADRRGMVLMERPVRAERLRGRQLRNPVVVAAARSLKSGVGAGRDAADEDRVYAFAPSRTVGDEGFLAVVSMEEAQVTASAYQSLGVELAALLLTLLAGMAGAWWLGGRMIVRPAGQILEAARLIEQGRLEARVPVHGDDQRGEFARIGGAFNAMADSLQARQRDLLAELTHSRDAYSVLDVVLNSMTEGVVAANSEGRFLMYNQAALRVLALHDVGVEPRNWSTHFGVYQPDGATLCPMEELPLIRAMRGETGQKQVVVRNALAPEGRLLQFSFRPMHGEGGISGGLVVFSDVTELQRLQMEQGAQFAQLQEAQRRLVEAHRIGRIGNWELDLDSQRFWLSDEAHGLLSVKPADFDGTAAGYMLRVHADDRGALEAARATAMNGGKAVEAEYRVAMPHGGHIWMHETAQLRRDTQGGTLAGVVRDITARKRSELALMDNERELQSYTRMLQRTADAAQAITSQQSLRGTLQEMASQARSVIGAAQATASLVTGEGWEQAITAAAASPRRSDLIGRPAPDGAAVYDLVMQSGRPLRLSRAELSADPLWAGLDSRANGLLAVALIDRTGQPVGLLMLLGKESGEFSERDEYVTLQMAQLASTAIDNARLFMQIRDLNAGLEARIAARTAELARQEARYRALADQAPVVVWNVDPAGRVTYMNRAWFELVGGSGGDWLGHNWRQRVHPDDLPAMTANWERSRETLLPYIGTRRILGRDGRWHTTSYRAAPVIEEGKVAFWVGIDSDITELKAIEQALRSSNDELQAFSYSVSHDLRAPLGAIGGFSRALQHKVGPDADERILHYVARIQTGVVKMEQLIDAMLSLAKVARAPLNLEPVDLSAMALDLLDELRAADAGRDVTARVQEGLTTLGDSRLLRVVVQNLLGNAWKFSSQREQAVIEVGTRGAGVFFVRDNGAGFDMAYAGKLFGAFQRLHTESEFPGTGIGLATVRRIITRHQGRVWAESEPGKGTTFFFSLSEKAPPAWLAGEEAPP